jgi:hypothetical protein
MAGVAGALLTLMALEAGLHGGAVRGMLAPVVGDIVMAGDAGDPGQLEVRCMRDVDVHRIVLVLALRVADDLLVAILTLNADHRGLRGKPGGQQGVALSVAVGAYHAARMQLGLLFEGDPLVLMARQAELARVSGI